MSPHHLPPDEQEARDLRIVKLAGLGVTHYDIGRAVGLATETISILLRRRKRANKTSFTMGHDSPHGLWRRSSVDGVYD